MKQTNLIPKDFQPKPGPMLKMYRNRVARVTAAIFIAAMPLVGSISCASRGKVKVPKLTQNDKVYIIRQVGELRDDALEGKKGPVDELITLHSSYSDAEVRGAIVNALAEILSKAKTDGDTETVAAITAFLGALGYGTQ